MAGRRVRRNGKSSSQSRRWSRSRSATSTAASARGACTSTAPVRIADERAAVERDGTLGADAVGHHHERAVGDPVGADHLLPERLGVELRVVGLGADRGGIDDHLGALERVQARDLGEPLVPTGREADRRARHLRHRVAGVADAEVLVLVVARGDGQVHLARARDERTIGRDDDRGVVTETAVVGAFVQATRARAHRVRAASRAANSWVRPPGSASGSTPTLAGPSGVIAKYGSERQLLQADELRTFAGGDRAHPRRARLRARPGRVANVPARARRAPAAGAARRRARGSRAGRTRCAGSSRHRHGLGDAVHAAATVGEHRPVDGHDLAARVLRADELRASRASVAAPVDRHDDDAVRDVPVHVRHRDARARRRRRTAASAPRRPRCPRPRGGRGCRPRSRGSGLAGSSQPWRTARPGATNATTLSTWPSVSASSAMPSREPDDPVDTERGAAARRSISALRHPRVAVRVEQAAFGRHERARAVDRDRTALEHERHLGDGQPELRRRRARRSSRPGRTACTSRPTR